MLRKDQTPLLQTQPLPTPHPERAEEAGLKVGDQVQVRINTASGDAEGPMRIVGDFDYFPTWYSEAEERVWCHRLQ